jgi:phosphoribosylaminoimidazole (AIR) synthetase
VPRIFTEIARLGHIDDAEMARVFNLGIGMVLIVDRASVVGVRSAVERAGVHSVEIGEVGPGSGSVVDR